MHASALSQATGQARYTRIKKTKLSSFFDVLMFFWMLIFDWNLSLFRYVDDVPDPAGCLHAAFVKSTVPHAKVLDFFSFSNIFQKKISNLIFVLR
jgi:hypothetical protein